MTFGKKLAILPFSALLGIVLVSALLMRDIGSVYHSASYGNDHTVPSLVALQKMDSNFVGERLNVWQHVASPDAAGMVAAEKQLAGRRHAIDEALEEYAAVVVDDGDKRLLESDRAAIVYYDSVKDKVLALSREGHKAEAIAMLMAMKAELAKAANALAEHVQYDVDLAKSASAAAEATRHSALLWGTVLTLATLAGVGGLGLAIHRQLTRQLGGEPADVAVLARKLSQGDFSTVIALRPGDTSSVMVAVAEMQRDLKSRVEADRARAEQERQHAEALRVTGLENARIRTALDGVSTGVMLADLDGQIIYANHFSLELFRRRANEIRTALPAFDAERVLGSSFDAFHANAAHQRNLLTNLAAAHTADISLGAARLRVTVTPIRDGSGARVGTAAQWIDRTDEVAVEQQVSTMVARAIDGDLTVRVSEHDKTGFLKSLAVGMNRLMESVTAVIRAMSQAAAEVRTGSEEISRGNLDLSQRTEEQASSLQQTAASMEQMTAMVKSNADNAAQANQLASAAREQAERGGTVVGTAVVAMNDINDASSKIADIIGVIDEIAFQTNLLALNAAVEAARAGDAGRGFAVVASEVRSLASRSAAAAKEIKHLIQDSVSKVAEGARLVDESGKALREIVTGVKKVTDVMAEIAASSQEQASGIDQVNKAVTSMDSVTQQNAALVEQASAAAHTLSEQAGTLTELIARYRWEDSAATPRGAARAVEQPALRRAS